MGLSDKTIKEYQRIFKESYNHPVSYEKAEEYGNRLADFFQLIVDMDMANEEKKARLKESPKGFPLDDGSTYNCCVCYRQVTGKEGWYDKYGNKCLNCQKALDKKVIPGYICNDRDSFYLIWELKDKFGIHHTTARKMVREGKLKARIIQNEHGKLHEYVFIIKENKKL
ncbi:MAG: hypothetical protein HOE19_03625 [Candidatus Komeilibacteria bacterium]|jgi:hypothetical protein|nr:hypothetical protein [Candidatus Komeilibacteria bacterium]MBT4447766.1 hypothetical protein [Candidatus Komeilibacteria bacterium]